MIVSTRLETPGDEAFVGTLLRRLIVDELQAWDWPEALRENITALQYNGRRQGARQLHPAGESRLILAGEAPAGWLLVDRSGESFFLVDIVVAPEFRGQGVASAVLRSLMQEAAAAGRPLRLMVRRINAPAIRLYERLGFRATGADDLSHFLEWVAPGE